MEEQFTDKTPEPGKVIRPVNLTILCILTFIGSGLSLLSSVFVLMAFDIIPEAARLSPMPGAEEMVQLVLKAGRLFFVVMGVLYFFSLAGAIFMWKLRKNGFHIYTISQLLMLAVPLLMIQGYQIPLASALLTASFVLAYGLNLKFMR